MSELRLLERDGELYRVASVGRGGESIYRVDLNRLRCECPATRVCKHLRFVQAQLAVGQPTT